MRPTEEVVQVKPYQQAPGLAYNITVNGGVDRKRLEEFIKRYRDGWR